jgi:hypothetical protein
MVRVPNADVDHVVGRNGGERHAEAVLSQLAKVLGGPQFRNSKRSQAMLRFVVESALTGEPDALKERCIGAAVFGRETAYDTGQDPIVRNAAIDVRKRLAQYYLEPEHASELRIDLPSGSYMPTFTAEAAPVPSPVVELPKPAKASRAFAPKKWIIALASLSVVVAVAAFLWSGRRTPSSELEAFWEPLFRDHKAIQVCIGQPTRLYRFTGPRTEELNRLLGGGSSSRDRDSSKLSLDSGELAWVAPEYLFMRDALSAFNVASWIQSKGRAYQLMSVANTNYSQLRHTPLVAIGAFNNAWAMRVTAELRFVFEARTLDGNPHNYIIDRRNPNGPNWKVIQPVGGPVTEDYAIVTKVFDPATEKTVITAAGIDTFGTLAASEFVTQAEYLGAALQAAPGDWRHKNIQFVLGTKIIDGTPGPPRVLATHVW